MSAHPVTSRATWRMAANNALLLSLVYLGIGVTVEALRRLFSWRLFERASLAMDALPGRALDLLGLMSLLRQAYAEGRLSEPMLRMVFGLTTLGIIFGMAVAVALSLALVRLALRQDE